MRLLRYILRRLAIVLAQLIAIVVVVFFGIRLLPADPVESIVGTLATPEMRQSTRHSLGLDRSLIMQFVAYLGLEPKTLGPGLLEGNLGISWRTGDPVLHEILHFLPITVELITYSFVVAILIAVPLGMLCAIRPNGIGDRIVFVYGLFAGAQPDFWWGLFFIFLFFVTVRIAPAPLGRMAPTLIPPPTVTGFLTVDSLLAGRADVFVATLWHLMLPVATLVLVLSGPIIKMVRQNMEKVLRSEFISYARANGLSPGQIAVYTLRNAFAPTITLIAILFAFDLGGVVLVEQVFSWGGLGQYSVHSILFFDFPAIQGCVLVIAALSLFVYLTLDILHAVLDPRVTL